MHSQSVRLLRLCTLVSAAALSASAAWAAPARPAITGIAHITLAAQSLAADRAFYTHYLGWAAEPSAEYPGGLSFYGDPRQMVEVHAAHSPSERAFDHVAWATPDAEAMRAYLAAKGVAVPAHVTHLPGGARFFLTKDPEGNAVEFYQDAVGVDMHGTGGDRSISRSIIHTGFIVRSAAAEDRFYRDILGFHLYWEGGMKPGTLDWVSMQVPDGTDWLEYMLNAGDHPSHHQIGVDDHFSLGVENMDAVVAAFQKRGFPPDAQHAKQDGKDGKWQLNLYDPDDVRIEFMEFKPHEKPCCHAFEGRQPGPNM